MICLSSHTEREEVAKRLLKCRTFIEALAKRAGHDDPPDFFGKLALEILSRHECLPLDMAQHRYLGWLARLRLRDYYRRRAAQPRSYSLGDQEYEARTKAHDEGTLVTGSHTSRTQNAFSKLSERSQEILIRKFLLGQSDGEVASKVGLCKSGVRSSVYRSRRLLAQLLRPTNQSE